MNILHGTWIPEGGKDFVRTGHFYLWIETDRTKKGRKGSESIHPSHLQRDDLISFLDQALKIKIEKRSPLLKDLIVHKFFTLPSTDGSPFPSHEMMKFLGADTPDDYKLKQWEICCLKIETPVKTLNDIRFMTLYTSDFLFGSDLLFWYRYTRSLKEIIFKDQYVPSLMYRRKKTRGGKKSQGFEIFPAWEIISKQYETKLKEYMKHIPFVCLGGFNEKTKKPRFYTKESLVRHFTENMLHESISRTSFTLKLDKQASGTFLYDCLYLDTNRLEPLRSEKAFEIYSKWLDWKNKLATITGESGLHLCFKLTEAENDTWRIGFIISSKKDPSLQIDLSTYWSLDKKRKETIMSHLGDDPEKNLLLNLGYAARIYPKIWEGLETDKPTGVHLQTSDAYEFLKESAWVLEDSGFKVIVPAWWTPKGRKKAKIRLKTSMSKGTGEKAAKGYFSIDSIITYQYELSIGDQVVTEEEWRNLIEAKSSLVKFRGEWMELDKDKMKEMLEFWQTRSNENSGINAMEMIKMSLTSESDIEFDHDESLSDMLAGLYEKSKLKPIDQPTAFQGTLRKYQIRGVSWLEYLEGLGLNPCLADDMGLGKTIQVIARLLREREKQENLPPTLLIAPTSVLGNWEKEVQRFAPGLKVLIHHGVKRIKDEDAFKEACIEHDIVISSFSLARRDEKLFRPMEWRRIVIDEAQNIKNPKSAQTKAVLKFRAQHRLALTGTPVENRLLDLWSIFNFLNPGYLGATGQFRKVFELPIQKENDPVKSDSLRKLVEPFILRRVKTDKEIIKDLPDKVEQKIYCNLTKEQASLYEAVIKDVNEQIEDSEGIQRKGLILSTLMKLKQICNHPRQFLQDESEFTRERSHKLGRISDMTEEAIESGESLLIFSQFREICDSLVHYLKKNYRYNTYYIHGGTARKRREEMIEEFQSDETEPSVFVLSLKAGGVGITLTKANHVFHFDRWWNPAVEDQATDRAFRIGQKKSVFAHKFITIGTLEERIDTMIEDKKKISSSIVGADESWLTELDNEAFKRLIALNRSAIMETE